ncbi:hypothetical protein Tco_0768342 [Tanacetum coccineum]
MASTLSRTLLNLSLVVVSSYESCEWSAITCIDSRRYEPSIDSSDHAVDIGKECHCIFPKHDAMSRPSLA